MTFYFAMINAWALAAEVLYGDMDKTYPIINPSEMKLRYFNVLLLKQM